MIKIKSGVQLDKLAPGGYCIIDALKIISKTLGVDLTITSGNDGEHSGPDDPHKHGNALDIRSKDLAPEVKVKVLNQAGRLLSQNHFFGFLENPGADGEHFHFQVAKGTTFTIEDYLAS
jgi:hypothetical protein